MHTTVTVHEGISHDSRDHVDHVFTACKQEHSVSSPSPSASCILPFLLHFVSASFAFHANDALLSSSGITVVHLHPSLCASRERRVSSSPGEPQAISAPPAVVTRASSSWALVTHHHVDSLELLPPAYPQPRQRFTQTTRSWARAFVRTHCTATALFHPRPDAGTLTTSYDVCVPSAV